MKEVRDWTETDLLELPKGEFDWLEVKGRRAVDLTLPNVKEGLVDETIAKIVSALANTGGGQLVLGLTDPGGSDQLKVDDGGIAVCVKGRQSTREWLENKTETLVDPRLRGFNVYEIRSDVEDTQIEQGRAVFVVDVPDSQDAPHQSTRDKRYYFRVAGRSKAMNNRQVRDILHRDAEPDILLTCCVGPPQQHIKRRITGNDPGQIGFVTFTVQNVGNITSSGFTVIAKTANRFIPKMEILKPSAITHDETTFSHTVSDDLYPSLAIPCIDIPFLYPIIPDDEKVRITCSLFDRRGSVEDIEISVTRATLSSQDVSWPKVNVLDEDDVADATRVIIDENGEEVEAAPEADATE